MTRDAVRRTGRGFRPALAAAMLVGLAAAAAGVEASPPAAVAAEERPIPPGTLRPEPLKNLGKPNKVRLVYFVPQDREPTAHWREKVTVLATFMADIYRRDLVAQGYPTTGLDFEFREGRLAVHLQRGRHPAARYNGDPKFDFMAQWDGIVPEVEAALGPASKNLFVIFAETYDDGPTRFEWRGGVALGARYSSNGGVGLFSAWVLRDEFCATTIDGQIRLFNDEAPIAGRVALGCGQMNSPRFEFVEDGFGAVAHETGHAFGLPHDTRKDDEYVMGNGFRVLRRNYAFGGPQPGRAVFSPDSARLLSWSRFLAEKPDLADNAEPTIALEKPAPLKAGATEVPIRGRATDDRRLAAVLYWWEPMDSTVGGAALEGTAADLAATLRVRRVRKGPCKLVVSVIDAGGNLATAAVTYDVEP